MNKYTVNSITLDDDYYYFCHESSKLVCVQHMMCYAAIVPVNAFVMASKLSCLGEGSMIHLSCIQSIASSACMGHVYFNIIA